MKASVNNSIKSNYIIVKKILETNNAENSIKNNEERIGFPSLQLELLIYKWVD